MTRFHFFLMCDALFLALGTVILITDSSVVGSIILMLGAYINGFWTRSVKDR